MEERIPIVAMNWSMRQNREKDSIEFAEELKQLLENEKQVEKILFPSMGVLRPVANVLKDTDIEVGAQNIAPYLHGEYSGEYSIESLVDIDGQYVELGHWERREIFNESDYLINKKLLLAVSNNVSVILCVGEKEKTENEQEIYSQIKRQLFNALLDLDTEKLDKLIVAYTPKWAVGKTVAANTPHAYKVCGMIRHIFSELFPSTDVSVIRIIYGGSVCPENTPLLVKSENIDGVLVGRFGSEPSRYAEIVKAIKNMKIH